MSTHDALDALVQRAVAGDTHALHGIYVHFAPRLHRFVLVRVRERADADDLVQRVFLKMIEALPRYEARGVPFAAWVFRLARNTVIDFERTRRSHETLDAIAEQPVDGASPRELAVLEAERAAVRAALVTLTPDQQDVITYRFFAGLSPAEIGALMNRREGSVRALQFRAIESLRVRLGNSSSDLFSGSASDPLGADPDPTPDEASHALPSVGLLRLSGAERPGLHRRGQARSQGTRRPTPRAPHPLPPTPPIPSWPAIPSSSASRRWPRRSHRHPIASLHSKRHSSPPSPHPPLPPRPEPLARARPGRVSPGAVARGAHWSSG